MCERLLRQSVCLHSQSPPQKLCVDDESLDSLVLVRGRGSSAVERATPGEDVPGSIPAVAARSLLVGSVSV